MTQLQLFLSKPEKKIKKVTNIASVPQRSPFRYPGGKTWLIPVVRQWLKQDKKSSVKHLIEPFAGGGIVSLTSAFENLSEKTTMIELDEEVAAVWEVIINGSHEWLASQILSFDLTPNNVDEILNKKNKSIQEKAFSTIIKNRIFHGGILARGAGRMKKGESGKGIASRWYPQTLHKRIMAIGSVKEKSKITFIHGDAFEQIKKYSQEKSNFFFIDPPYQVAGRRLYTHSEIEHEELFLLISKIKGKFMLTYDDTPQIRDLIEKYKLLYRLIPMKTTHHVQKNEIIISDNFTWWE